MIADPVKGKLEALATYDAVNAYDELSALST